MRLLGRRGKGATFRVADFRTQSGLYVLYGNYGPYYVGLVRSNRLGNRLRDHLTDRHKGKWDRFSWFGFRNVLRAPNRDGICLLGEPLPAMPVESTFAIRDIEALLIRALGLGSNIQRSGFVGADQWVQIKEHEVDRFLRSLSRNRR